jgi:PII-like signaling protein
MVPIDARLIRICVNASDRWQGHRLYEAIVTTARTLNIAGASVFPVEVSYGSGLRIHDNAGEYGFVDLPVVVEIIDAPDRIDALIAGLGAMIAGAMVTVASVRVYRHPQEPR